MNHATSVSSWRIAASPKHAVIKTRFLVTAFVILYLLSFLLGNIFPRFPLRTWSAEATVFFLRVNTFFLNDLLQFLQSHHLVRENRNLRRQVAQLMTDVSSLKEKNRATQRLEELLSFQKNPPESVTLFCRIIGRDPSHWSQTFLLDRGRKDGMEKEMAVVGTKGLVGRVAEVEERWSKALLVTDPDSKVGAMVERSRESGLVVGATHGFLTMEYLSSGADIREGDTILTAGFGGIFPKGIVIGEVIGIGRREEDLMMYALIKPAEGLSQLEEVLCVKKK